MRKRTFTSLILGVSLLAGCGTGPMPSVSHQDSTHAGTQNQAKIEWAFTNAGQHPEKKLEEMVGSAKQSLDIAIYSLTKPDIVKAIVDAKKRGVAVRIITDQQEAQNRSKSTRIRG
ncbi:phospholipase D-like domain-containing protein [Effusibacillus pohliae]|uniref:phospholipase D-like domain-containing protein n=1 Tax=Effusibacillus pohliae TaxID=232270 RepID=UPI0003A9F03B|nr:phospholipase D-like domain-containing protein [Effusibacillus pohliae]